MFIKVGDNTWRTDRDRILTKPDRQEELYEYDEDY